MPTNFDRAERARRALRTYSSEDNMEHEDIWLQIKDLVNDLQHLADFEGLSFSDLVFKADVNHSDERIVDPAGGRRKRRVPVCEWTKWPVRICLCKYHDKGGAK